MRLNYYLLSKEHVSVAGFEGEEILKVAPEALTLLAQQAFHDAAFMLRVSHQQQVASILLDPEASENDKYVALQFLRNSEIAAKGILPTCQDTGTAIIMGKKASAYGPAAAMRPRWRRASTTPIPKITCAIRRTLPSICIKRSTPAPTCRRRLTSIALTATNTNSYAWQKAAARPTKPISTRRPRR
ncbi:Fumarate hydratase class I, aerobic [Raoultella terrigena]|uniref:Fumarate hydratase class I, aerobic n=1 Tax=Raoultella terrigena TaxID=577 RepID=A0A4U9CZY5_RAOTE|nr:Fumarate hydratase class I, aerobic [Raoultella terrigena]